MEENAVMKKKKKMDRVYLIIALIALAITILMGYLIYETGNQELSEPVDLHNIIYGYTKKEDAYAKIDVQYLTDSFARYGDGSANDEYYYFATDTKGYGYIVSLTHSTFSKLKEINEYTYNEDAEMPDAITITGVTKPIPEDIKNIAVDIYSEIYETSEVTSENFEDYYGTVYLKEGASPTDTSITIYSVVIFISLIFFIISIIFYIVIKVKTKLKLKKIKQSGEFENIELELSSNEKEEFKKIGTVLTKSYIIDGSFGLEVIKYQDIEWIYEHKVRTNGIVTKRSIIIIAKDKKKYKVAVTDANPFSKKTIKEFNEIFNKIIEKTPNALVGYTKENIEKMKGKRLV